MKFIHTLNAQISCSLGVVACPRTTNGIVIAFGDKASEEIYTKKDEVLIKKGPCNLCCNSKN